MEDGRYIPASPSAGPSATLLSSIQELLGQPLVNDPLTGAAAVLSGFGAGTMGKPNPVLEQLATERNKQLTLGVTLADLQHKSETARIDVLYKNAMLGHQKATEERDRQRLALDKTRASLDFGIKSLDIADKTDSPEVYGNAVKYFQDAGVFPMFDPKEIEAARSDKKRRQILKENFDVLVAKAVLGDFEDPDLKQYGENLVAAAKNPEKRPLLLQMLKAVPPDVILSDWNTKVAENSVKKLHAELDSAAAAVTKRLQSGQPAQPGDTNILMMHQMFRKAATPDQVAMFGLMFQGAGMPIPAGMTEAVGAWRKKIDLVTKQTSAAQSLIELRAELVKLNRLKNWVQENTKEPQVLNGLLEMVETLAKAAESAQYAPTQRDALNATINKLRQEVQKEIDKRNAPPPGADAPAAPPPSPASREDALRQRYLR